MSDKIGSILFKPTCSNCGRVIDGDVKYRSDFNYQTITPSVCQYCGCVFENIALPNATNWGRFHYNGEMYKPYYEIKIGDY